MIGSGKIQVIKRGGWIEAFSASKLAGAIWRATRPGEGRYTDARDLSAAVEIYLRRTGRIGVSAAVVFEMAVKILRRAGMEQSAVELELHRAWRRLRRESMCLRYEDGKAAKWDKQWLADLAHRSWNVSVTTARIVAGQIEAELMESCRDAFRRLEVIDRLNVRMVELGLADAVPVRMHSVDP